MTYLNYFHQTADTQKYKSTISYDEEKHQMVIFEQLNPASLGFFSATNTPSEYLMTHLCTLYANWSALNGIWNHCVMEIPVQDPIQTQYMSKTKAKWDFGLRHYYRHLLFCGKCTCSENSLARSLCLTLLGGYKGLSGGPLLLLYHCGWGQQGGCDPRRALLSPLQALLQTHGCILRHTCRHPHRPGLVTRGWAGLCEEMRRCEKG